MFEEEEEAHEPRGLVPWWEQMGAIDTYTEEQGGRHFIFIC